MFTVNEQVQGDGDAAGPVPGKPTAPLCLGTCETSLQALLSACVTDGVILP